MKKFLIGLFIGLSFIGTTAYGLSVFTVPQGGTGASTLTGCLEGNGTGAITGTGSACGSGSGGVFSWTVNSWGNSTTSTLGFLNGFLSTASSTISSALRLSSLSQGFLYIGSTGLVQPIASSSIQLSWFNNDAGFITTDSTASTTLLGDFNTWTGRNNFTYASTSQLDVTGTATTTFGGSITLGHPYTVTTHAVRGDASDGLFIVSNNYTPVASFGSANTANSTFYGAVNIDGSTRLATSLTGLLKASSGTVSTGANGTDYTLISATACSAGNHVSEITAAGVITCSADTGSGGSGLASSTPWTFGSLVVAKDNGSVTTISTSTIKISQLTNDANFVSFPFTVNTGYNSTTSVIGFTNGIFSLSSTTLNGTRLTDLSQGYSYIGSNGLVQTVSTSTLASQVFSATTYPANSIITTNTSGNLQATGTQLTVGNIIASTSANNIFSGSIIAAGDGVQYIGGTGASNRFYITAYGITDGNTSQAPGQFRWQSGTGGTNIQSSAFNVGSDLVFGWSGGDVNAIAKDTAFSRLSAGRLALGNGSASDVTGGLSMKYSSTTYASFITASSTFSQIGTLTLSTTTVGCLNTGATGIVYASTCASGLSSYDAWTHPSAGQSATTSLMQLFGQASTSQITATSSAYLATETGGVSIGTTTTSKLLYVYGNQSGGISRIHRKLTATTGQVGTQDFLAESDTQMTDGFGPGLNFLGQDQDGVVNTLGQIFALRNGTDNSGGLLFNSFSGGSAITSFMTLPVGANAMGTSTVGQYGLTVASSTKPQLSLSAGAGVSQWVMRNAGGLFYLATTTVAGTATSTVSAFSINANGFPTVPSLGTGLILSTAGLQSTYAGATCTNQFVRVLSASGAATCATVAAADVSLANLTATNSTLTFSGTYNGSTARTIGINLATANTWTGKASFNANASTTGISANYGFFGGTATTTITQAGSVGISSSTPFAMLSVNPSGALWPFIIGSSTRSLFGVNNFGTIVVGEDRPATSTTITLDWSKTKSQITYQIGTSATTINIINATTSLYAGSTKRVMVCNPGSTAGAVTWTGVEWIGTAPTQTTTASQCDLWSFFITTATSTTAYKVAGGMNAGFQ